MFLYIANNPLLSCSFRHLELVEQQVGSWFQLTAVPLHHLRQLSPVPRQLPCPSWLACYPALPAARTRPILTLVPSDPWTDGLRLLLNLDTSLTRLFR